MNEEEFNLKIDNFDGPLDLLLSLVKDHKMDLFSINLFDLASAYLKLIETLKNKDIDLASEYLVMAATLIQLKARMILDNPDDKEDIEVQKKDILNQLVEYQQFKEISKKLRDKESNRKNIFIKEREDYTKYNKPIDETKLDGNSDAIKLIIALRKMFERNNARKLRETTIEAFKMTVGDRRLELLEIFKVKDNPSFDEIFSVPSLNHFILTILTILDMARKQEIILEQPSQYDQIIIRRGELNV